jgi:hypothetical protein
MRKRNCCTRGESLFKEDSPARTPGNPVRRAPSAQATQPLTWGPRLTSHASRVLVSECEKANRRARSKPLRTIAHRLGAAVERYLLTTTAATRHPAGGPTEPPEVGPWVSQPRGQMWQLT